MKISTGGFNGPGLGVHPASSHFIDQSSVTWAHLTARQAEKYNEAFFFLIADITRFIGCLKYFTLKKAT